MRKHSSIHTHKHTMKVTVTCPPTLKQMGSTTWRHLNPPPPAPINREKRMTENEEKVDKKVKMKGGDLVLTTPLTIQMVGETTALATPCPTIANPLYPGVTVDIVPLRDTQRGE